MDLSGMNVAVIGLGASGIAAARLAAEKGGDVYVSDSRTDDAVAARRADLGDGVEVDLGRHDLERMVDADLVVASPGIPPDAPVLRGLAERGVRWISEPEFAARRFGARVELCPWLRLDTVPQHDQLEVVNQSFHTADDS